MTKVVFVRRTNGPERLICEAELLFDAHPLEGCKLVGISLWSGADGEIYVTMPSRSTGVGADRKYFDFLRGQGGDAKAVKALKAWIVDAYREESGGEEEVL